jgi:hypothetical protein
MPLDYGQRAKPRTLRGLWWGIVPGVAVVAAALSVNATYRHRVEVAEGWIAEAAPCPKISAAAYRAAGYAARERLTAYDGATVTRQFGHVMCSDVDTPRGWGLVTHPVCQFTSPTAIRVSAGKGEAFFVPGPGQLATVSVEPGGATCVLASKFTLFNDPTNRVGAPP